MDNGISDSNESYSVFGKMSVRAKLFSGFGFVIALTILLAVLGYRSVKGFESSLNKLSDMTEDAQLVTEFEGAIANFRIQILKYVTSSSEVAKAKAMQAQNQVNQYLGSVKREIQKPERVELIKQIESAFKNYITGFHEIDTLIQKRNDIVLNRLNRIGPEIRMHLGDIQEGVFEARDHLSMNYGGSAQQDILLARLSVIKFLDTNSAEDALRASREFKNLAGSLEKLDPRLQEPRLRQSLKTARELVSRYQENFKELVETINRRNEIRTNVLDQNGALISDLIGQVKASAKEDQRLLQSEADANVKSSEKTSFGVPAVVLLIGALVAYVISRKISLSIRRTVEVVNKIAIGNFDERVQVDSADELGVLGRNINQMAVDLKESQEESARARAEKERQDRAQSERERQQALELQSKVDQILEVVREAENGDLTQEIAIQGTDAIGQMSEGLQRLFKRLRSNLKDIAGNSESLSTASEKLASVSQMMAGNAEETTAQANLVTGASNDVNQNVSTVAASTEQMGASINEIARSVNEATLITREAVKAAKNTNTIITQLDSSSSEIGQVVKMITSIAEQTNLLALNATIEAARAGEAGKGFAVVANEVKELANQTAKATENIGKSIQAIQADTRNSVDAISEITQIIDKISEISTVIASAVEEQQVTTVEITRNITSASQATGEISHNIAGVSQAAQSTSIGAVDCQKAAQEMEMMAGNLKKLVGGFKI